MDTNVLVGIATFTFGGLFSIIGILFQRAQNQQDNLIKANETAIKELTDRQRDDMNDIQRNLNEVNLNILKDLREISVRLAEFKNMHK